MLVSVWRRRLSFVVRDFYSSHFSSVFEFPGISPLRIGRKPKALRERDTNRGLEGVRRRQRSDENGFIFVGVFAMVATSGFAAPRFKKSENGSIQFKSTRIEHWETPDPIAFFRVLTMRKKHSRVNGIAVGLKQSEMGNRHKGNGLR